LHWYILHLLYWGSGRGGGGWEKRDIGGEGKREVQEVRYGAGKGRGGEREGRGKERGLG